MPLLEQNPQHYTYSDYYEWDDGKRWELIEGIPYAMSPAPVTAHQRIIGELYLQIANFLKGKPCKVFPAPFDVRLNSETYDDTVVQPDIVIVCEKSKINDKGCKGVPDMVIEVLSPSTARHDRVVKFKLYQRAGVREYWIVDPDSRTVSIHILENSKYTTSAFDEDDTASVYVLEGCEINLSEVFADI